MNDDGSSYIKAGDVVELTDCYLDKTTSGKKVKGLGLPRKCLVYSVFDGWVRVYDPINSRSFTGWSELNFKKVKNEND